MHPSGSLSTPPKKSLIGCLTLLSASFPNIDGAAVGSTFPDSTTRHDACRKLKLTIFVTWLTQMVRLTMLDKVFLSHILFL